MNFSDLPTLNACFNAGSAVCLSLGYYCIRQKKLRAHAVCMICALGSSTLFLAGYLTYHAVAGTTKFTGQGWIRPLYFTILITHTLLAGVIVPLIFVTLRRAWQRRFEAHQAIARWTWPLWMYVSVTGVIIYLMLYQFYPARH